MGRRDHNILSGRHTATSSYTTLFAAGTVKTTFGLLPVNVDLLLSIGHATAADATSILVPAGQGFELEHGIVGPIQVKSGGVDQTIYHYHA